MKIYAEIKQIELILKDSIKVEKEAIKSEFFSFLKLPLLKEANGELLLNYNC